MPHTPDTLNLISRWGGRRSTFIINHNKTLLLAALISSLLPALAASAETIDIASGADISNSLVVLREACGATRFPDHCFASIAGEPGLAEGLSSQRDVIDASLNLTTSAVKRMFLTIKRILSGRPDLTRRERGALRDCLADMDRTLDELQDAELDLKSYPSNKSLNAHADDLKSLLSAAMTNQVSCEDGFSHDRADKRLREKIVDGLEELRRMCSNALAMIKNMTDADMEREGRRRAAETVAEEGGWPEWLAEADRRMLQEEQVAADIVVAADGSGNYRTLGEAVAAAPERSSRRFVIRIKAGVYRENVEVGKRKTNLMFVGDGRSNTIITGRRNVVDGSTTFNSATVAVVGDRFLARDITFENTAGPSKHQAVALRVGADFSAFYRCDMLAYQDTLYVHSLRQFYRSCIIAGTVDFIFGNAATVIQDCDIHARRPNRGQRNMVTAQGRDDPNQNTGISIHRSRIGATSDLRPVAASFPTYLGRPWKLYSRTVILQTDISGIINPAGWFEWNGDFALNTLYYAEYGNTGAGAGTANRVKWRGYKGIISANEAQQFTAGTFIGGGGWLSSTGFPFSLGLSG